MLVINSGHWDLREGSVESYAHALLDLMETLAPIMDNWHGLKIWRTTPPYALNGSGAISFNPLASNREYRTNEKIDEGNRIAADIVKKFGFVIHDTHAILRPMWDHPCDTHHYQCAEVVNAGLVDMQLFLYSYGGCSG